MDSVSSPSGQKESTVAGYQHFKLMYNSTCVRLSSGLFCLSKPLWTLPPDCFLFYLLRKHHLDVFSKHEKASTHQPMVNIWHPYSFLLSQMCACRIQMLPLILIVSNAKSHKTKVNSNRRDYFWCDLLFQCRRFCDSLLWITLYRWHSDISERGPFIHTFTTTTPPAFLTESSLLFFWPMCTKAKKQKCCV